MTTRALTAGQITKYAATAASLAICAKLKRVDGTIIGLTAYDADMTLDLGDGDGAVLYEAQTASVDFNAGKGAADLTVDTSEVTGFFESTRITAADIDAGRYDKCEVVFFEVDPDDIVAGVVYRIPSAGWIGEVEIIGNDSYRAEIRGLTQAYSVGIVEVTSALCRYDLGDSDCMAQIEPAAWPASTAVTAKVAGFAEVGTVVKPTTANGAHFVCTTAGTTGASEPAWDATIGNTTADNTAVWTAIKPGSLDGTVTGVTDDDDFAATGITVEAGWWGPKGRVRWLTGNNAGLVSEVKTDDGAGALTLFLPTVFAIQVGDTFRAIAACNKVMGDDDATGHCVNRFDNGGNHGGEPHIPGTDVALQTPVVKRDS